eukprot:gnl/Dysnectes_brevis/5254_a7472_389.p1 GENE.gnl/Dysnectes_brevis/5254_a7472_389~~gnl/Dysnectes_brevis/5254_a7472_389.p1  ORF type:complete len:261 (-),score=91.28 gnl/Dysnectes_brevis/5254_a7472_389:96-878(-)
MPLEEHESHAGVSELPTPHDIFQRLILAVGEDSFAKYQQSKVMIIGCGAVGGQAFETLARCAVGSFVLVDFDTIDVSNINRQIVALTSTLGRLKVDVARERILDINPHAAVLTVGVKVDRDTLPGLLADHRPDLVLDATDLFHQKAQILEGCARSGVPVVSSMGAARKQDPSRIRLAPLHKTTNCPLARKMRQLVKKSDLPADRRRVICAVYSTEDSGPHQRDADGHGTPLPSFAVMTAAMGLWCAKAALGWIEAGEFVY